MQVIKSYHLQPDKVLRLDLDRVIKPHIQFVIDCRPHSISMGFVIRVLRRMIQVCDEESERGGGRQIMEGASTSAIAPCDG